MTNYLPALPKKKELTELLLNVKTILESESNDYRPLDINQKPGGLIQLQKKLPVILVPDLHSRYFFLKKVLNYRMPSGDLVIDLLKRGQIYVICVGDGLHSEKREKERWLNAFDCYMKRNYTNNYLTEEMQEGLSVMSLVMECKCLYPEYFHFLKGNHENILNEEANGNFPFRKFVIEGEIVKTFMLKTYGKKILSLYSEFEKLLPLFVFGYSFLVSHAEPKDCFAKDEIINGMSNERLVSGLTWTKNDDVSGIAVKQMLLDFLPNDVNSRYFSGHRPVEGLFNLRAEGKLIQFHNPDKTEICIIKPDVVFNENIDIIEI